MRLEILGLGEEGLVGGDDRQFLPVGEVDDARLCPRAPPPCRAAPAPHRAGRQRLFAAPQAAISASARSPAASERVERPVMPAGQRDQPGGGGGERGERHRLGAPRLAQIEGGDEADQRGIACRRLRPSSVSGATWRERVAGPARRESNSGSGSKRTGSLQPRIGWMPARPPSRKTPARRRGWPCPPRRPPACRPPPRVSPARQAAARLPAANRPSGNSDG